MAKPQFMYPDPGDAVHDSRPCFNRDGSKVVFMREVDDIASLWTVETNTDGSGEPKLLFPATPGSGNQATRPDWSWHDGRIAFSGVHNEKRGLFVIDADGSNPRHIDITVAGVPLADDSKIQYPSWYPLGKHIAVTHYGVYRTLKVAMSGDATWWTDAFIQTGQSSVNQASSDQVCAAAQRRRGDYDQTKNHIWVQPSASELPHCIQVEGHGYGRAPWFSPDGNFIAYESDYDTVGSNYSIYIYRRFNQCITRVTPRENWDCTHAKFHPKKANRIVVGANHVGHRRGIAIVDFDASVTAPL